MMKGDERLDTVTATSWEISRPRLSLQPAHVSSCKLPDARCSGASSSQQDAKPDTEYSHSVPLFPQVHRHHVLVQPLHPPNFANSTHNMHHADHAGNVQVNSVDVNYVHAHCRAVHQKLVGHVTRETPHETQPACHTHEEQNCENPPQRAEHRVQHAPVDQEAETQHQLAARSSTTASRLTSSRNTLTARRGMDHRGTCLQHRRRAIILQRTCLQLRGQPISLPNTNLQHRGRFSPILRPA